ncbi:methyltransferase domain-containing protein [Paenibacillus sp. P96]|uniref:Methyltransferase domain-containing protein n=1 Tax=Paenibacillus zeirhizosphaerae TaxID=2987519 RepID=A0ABT9FXV8_9BACL|nr:methyltransferase domain-containing protein [Paenibacillus sp. P96]MDP4099356.1 methyltransferase domain-containing protein [Paenibacillus sp. P96]
MRNSILIIGGCGYIGSKLYSYLSKRGYAVDTVDLEIYGNSTNPANLRMHYRDLTKDQLSKYDSIIHLAAHSSVQMAVEDPRGAFHNNLIDFYDLLDKVGDTVLIYASSSSVYTGTGGTQTTEESKQFNVANMYDLTKYTADQFAAISGKNYYALRFGTVNGSSANLRLDLMINRMVWTTLQEGKIKINNSHVYRPLLGMNDLCRAIEAILTGNGQPGVYNLASFNSTVLDIAEAVSRIMNVPIERLPDSTAYNFSMDSSKFERTYQFAFNDTIESIVEDLLEQHHTTGLEVRRYKRLTRCLCCDSENLHLYANLGHQPLANSYHDGTEKQPDYPLEVNVCQDCFHSQLSIAVNPDLLFKHYLYVSGTTATLQDYFRSFVETVEQQQPKKKLRVLDIASNDGSLLEHFAKKGHEVQGVDPAENLREISADKGVPTLVGYWDLQTARRLKQKYDVIVAMNVLAHVSNPQKFLLACREVLAEGGKIYIQTSQSEMFKRFEFDTIYHEHHSFFTTRSFRTLAKHAGLKVIHGTKVPVHGTSYLWTLGEADATPDASVREMEEEEEQAGFYTLPTYRRFGEKMKQTADRVHEAIREYADRGYKIVGYGAAAKGNTFLNFAKLDLDFIVDDNPLKNGMLTPGRNIPIRTSDALRDIEQPLFVLVLSWNFFDEIVSRIRQARSNEQDVYMQYFPEGRITS